MTAFTGQWDYSVDDKGRLAMPAPLRRALNPEAGDAFMATRGEDRCLVLYPQDYWQGEIVPRLARLNTADRAARRVVRTIMRWGDPVTLDSQGRVKLSQKLLEFAGIQGKAVVIGMLDRVEVWDPEAFEAYDSGEAQPLDDGYAELFERVLAATPPAAPPVPYHPAAAPAAPAQP